jgi:transposase
MAVEFIPIDRDTPYIFPPSVQDYLPEDHLARFLVDIVEQLDLSQLSAVYSGRGSKPFHPALLVALLFYGYATGVFSSRKLEKASYDSIAFRYICANTNPDHDTIASFRKRFLFVEILVVAEAMGLMKLGTISLDGTKIKANASKHKALSWEYPNRLEAQLKQEV